MNDGCVTRPFELDVRDQRLALEDGKLICLTNGIHESSFVLHHAWEHVKRVLDLVNFLALFVELSSYLVLKLRGIHVILILQLKVLEYLLVVLSDAKDRVVIWPNALQAAAMNAGPLHVVELVAKDLRV